MLTLALASPARVVPVSDFLWSKVQESDLSWDRTQKYEELLVPIVLLFYLDNHYHLVFKDLCFFEIDTFYKDSRWKGNGYLATKYLYRKLGDYISGIKYVFPNSNGKQLNQHLLLRTINSFLNKHFKMNFKSFKNFCVVGRITASRKRFIDDDDDDIDDESG
jgi:hypothetical protein